MQSSDMATRESIDSARSTSPLIVGPPFQPPPHDYPVSNDKAPRNDKATKVNISVVIVAFRILALVSSFAIGVSFAILRAWRVVTILLIVLTWLSAAWNAIVLIGLIRELRNLSLRVTLVLGDGRVINLGASNGDGGERKRRRCSPRAFWVDIFLVAALFAFNIAEGVTGRRYLRKTVALNWITITLNFIIALLTCFPALVTAHVRFETVEIPQISLP
ncbi:hypothetical protein GGR51DRAFT_44770 [Nemania sp. FL0031]|nr:hypothetical protein GGR51DRAFT_44770 [Nemania sp. FL0031]